MQLGRNWRSRCPLAAGEYVFVDTRGLVFVLREVRDGSGVFELEPTTKVERLISDWQLPKSQRHQLTFICPLKFIFNLC